MRLAFIVLAGLTLAASAAPSALCQDVRPLGADTLSAQAVAESLIVLHMLDSVVHAHPRDAAAWHRLGMIAWALTTRDKAKSDIKALDHTRLGRMADTSLRIAVSLARDSAQYAIHMAQFLQSSGHAAARFAGNLKMAGALVPGRASADPDQHAEAAVAAGRARWLVYETFAHRRMETPQGPAPRSINAGSKPFARLMPKLAELAREELLNSRGDPNGSGRAAMDWKMTQGQLSVGPAVISLYELHSILETATTKLPPELQGVADYRAAEALFIEAYGVAPTHAGAFRNYAMLLIEKERWAETRDLARGQLSIAAWDPWAWLALGLADHRLNDDKAAAAAFDSALAYLTPSERQRIDRVERILPGVDSARLNSSTADDRAALTRRFWLSQDQLWSVDHSTRRVEFLARVAYAELRWTVEELSVKGADTDRGEVFIRYGPPNDIIGLAPAAGQDVTVDVTSFWWYDFGLLFAFGGKPTYGTMRFPVSDVAYTSAVMEIAPVRWSNVASIVLDSLPLRTARFRAGSDSVDLVVASLAPVDSIRASNTVRRPVRINVWLLDRRDASVARDSVPAEANVSTAVVHRILAGEYLLRAEASSPGAMRGASATARVTADIDSESGFSTRGFGMSDILLASHMVEPAPSRRSWREVDLRPVAGPLSRREPLAIAWESYELGERDGRARYDLVVSIERQRGAGGRVAASILDKLGEVVGIQRSVDRVAFEFTRDVAFATTIVEAMQLDLRDTPTGTYTLKVQLTDRLTGRSTSRATTVEIRE